MSIKTWKKIITLTIVVILLILLILTLFFGIGYFRYEKKLSAPTVVDMAEYGYQSAEDMEAFFKQLESAAMGTTLDYQAEYPDLYVDCDFDFAETEAGQKICYLTFDDGPNREVTPQVLDTLKEYGIKATFFVIYRDGGAEKALYKRIVEEGHTIGIHTASHNYNKIYASVEAYLADFQKISAQVESVTGVKPEIIRFPGGSVNVYNKAIYKQLIAEMTRRGYVYYDWNSSTGDASGGSISVSDIVSYSLSTGQYDKKILLCHDGPGHQNTAKALPDIIEGLMEQGYSFAALDNSVAPICFGY